MNKNTKNEEETKGTNGLKNGLKVAVVLSIGAGIYGFKLGRQSGLRKGIEVGYIAAGADMIEALREHAGELRKSRGE